MVARMTQQLEGNTMTNRAELDPPPQSSEGAVIPREFRNNNQEGWQNRANCLGVDPDLFFPERGASTREAKDVCKDCVVREECLEFAFEEREVFGIWGGMSERQRRRIRRQRALARGAAGVPNSPE